MNEPSYMYLSDPKKIDVDGGGFLKHVCLLLVFWFIYSLSISGDEVEG